MRPTTSLSSLPIELERLGQFEYPGTKKFTDTVWPSPLAPGADEDGVTAIAARPARHLGEPSTSPCSHFECVLRDSPVIRTSLRSDFLPWLCNRRILPIMSMVITPSPLLHKKAAGQVVHLAQSWVGTALKSGSVSVGANGLWHQNLLNGRGDEHDKFFRFRCDKNRYSNDSPTDNHTDKQ